MNFKDKADALGFAEDEFQDLLELFVDATTQDLKKLKSAIEDGAMVTAAETAHSIKGAARGFDFDELARQAEAIEKRARGQDLGRNRDILTGLEAGLDEIIAALHRQC